MCVLNEIELFDLLFDLLLNEIELFDLLFDLLMVFFHVMIAEKW